MTAVLQGAELHVQTVSSLRTWEPGRTHHGVAVRVDGAAVCGVGASGCLTRALARAHTGTAQRWGEIPLPLPC